MELTRCLRIVPLAAFVLLGAASLGASAAAATPAAQGGPAWVPSPCPGGPGGPPGDGTAWYRLDPELDTTGTLAHQRLTVGAGTGGQRTLVLAPESFASGPVGGRVLSGEDNGRTSTLRMVDPVRGCAVTVVVEADVVRSGVLAPDGRALYEHRVERQTRADLGVWRRSLGADGQGGTAVRVLDPLPADDRYGPTFATDLRVASDGSVVASSCGQRLCRDRALDPRSGRVLSVEVAGPALGMADGRLVARAACAGYPCSITATDQDGRMTVLVAEAGDAALAGSSSPFLVFEAPGGSARILEVRTGRSAGLRGTAGQRPLGGGSLATDGADAAPGNAVLAPGGRAAGSGLLRIDPSAFFAAGSAELVP